MKINAHATPKATTSFARRKRSRSIFEKSKLVHRFSASAYDLVPSRASPLCCCFFCVRRVERASRVFVLREPTVSSPSETDSFFQRKNKTRQSTRTIKNVRLSIYRFLRSVPTHFVPRSPQRENDSFYERTNVQLHENKNDVFGSTTRSMLSVCTYVCLPSLLLFCFMGKIRSRRFGRPRHHNSNMCVCVRAVANTTFHGFRFIRSFTRVFF